MYNLLKGKNRLIKSSLCVILSMALLCSCSNQAQNIDIITQKPSSADKTQITVLVKYAFSINGFEKAVEEKFPNVDIVQVGNYTHSMGIDEYEARLKNDDLTDIVMTWPLDVGKQYWQDRLLDLSGMNFTSKYHVSMLNDIATDDKLYYLPGPAQVRGIVYNKTLFEENGWQVPNNYNEFIELCKTIEQSGIRSIQFGFENQEVLDTAFIGYNFAECFSKPQDVQWISEYNQGNGSFGTHFGVALDRFQDLIDNGIFRKSDLDVGYALRERMLFRRECAMVEDSVLLARLGKSITGTTDKFALMPFFNPDDGGDWARLYMVCYIGLNKHLAEQQNKEKYDLVMDIMEYISTPQGQEALMIDTGAMFSSLRDAPPPNIPEIDDLQIALSYGRYAVFPAMPGRDGVLREGLTGMLKGEMTTQDVINLMDSNLKEEVASVIPETLGDSTQDFTLIDTGNFITDVMREYADTDIALFLDNGMDGRYNGKGLSGKLYSGEITAKDILRILPDFKEGETGELCKVEMTGADITKALEYSISVNNNETGWFYYFSGLNVSFDPTAEIGSRVKSITLADGKPLEKDKTYSVAIMHTIVDPKLYKSPTETGKTIYDLLCEYIKTKGTISPVANSRFIIVK